MNISPTPRRYTSRNGDFVDDNIYPYSDPIDRNSHAPRERIVPEEYRLNSQMINRLIRQNKELMNKLDSKQEEIDRLNVLVGSLRGKLIKYTELNKKLQESMGQTNGPSRSSSDGVESSNYIQLPKRRDNNVLDKENENQHKYSKDDRISALSQKLDMLTRLMMDGKTGTPLSSAAVAVSPPPATGGPQVISPGMPSTAQTILNRPSEEDIMCRESMELKQLEDQIESLKRKLLIKRENELRKISLNQELLELMEKLSMEQAQVNSQTAPAPPVQPSQASQVPQPTPEYCAECHHAKSFTQHHNHHRKDVERPSVPAPNPLETPTPFAKRANLAASTGDLTDTINRIW